MSSAFPPLSVVDPASLRAHLRLRVDGRVTLVAGHSIEGSCPGAAVGDLVQITPKSGSKGVLAEVVGLRNGRVLLVALGDVRGICAGSRLTHVGTATTAACSDGLLGHVIDARGRSLAEGHELVPGPFVHRPLYAEPPSPLSRALIDTPLHVGVRAIDGTLTLGRGQRIGIVAGAGVGKSHLLGMLTQNAQVDVVVLALIGERGREVGEFLERVLGPTARRKAVVVVATSDQAALERVRAAFLATSIAEHFADRGKHVLLMMDSLTRFAMAQRELGLGLGEPPTTKGYTPSVFAQLPRLLERAGSFRGKGSITGIYTVLVEGDDVNDPVGDAARSILDGHMVLSRDLAARSHFPAIDVLASISRVQDHVMQPAHLDISRRFRRLLAQLREAEELVSIGAHVPGADADLDRALQRRPAILAFLRQTTDDRAAYPQTVRTMAELTKDVT